MQAAPQHRLARIARVTLAAVVSVAVALAIGTARPHALLAQLIQVKTLPIAEGDQWQIFPSANQSLGGLAIALADPLLDPFVNPAKGSRVPEGRHGSFFGSPAFYALSHGVGGGRTFPLGGLFRTGQNFAGFAFAVQQVDSISASDMLFPRPLTIIGPQGGLVPPPATAPRQNQFAYAMAGHRFAAAGISLGVSAQWDHLNVIDGVDMLYAGSRAVDQHGSALDLRVGLLKEFAAGQSVEVMLLHNAFDMTHDVTWSDPVWDPNTRQNTARARLDHNHDRTDTWGLHLDASRPVGDSGWRIGAILTTNVMTHPKLPDYHVQQVMPLPWDPGYTTAFDIGLGVAKAKGPTTFGLDAIVEPIRTRTWGEASDSIVTAFGTIPRGGKTTENWFTFGNLVLRMGAAQALPLDTLRGPMRAMRFEGGLALRSIAYTLDQLDHTTRATRTQHESWIEWTPAWGFVARFSDLEFHYNGSVTTGTGRPGVAIGDQVFAPGVTNSASGQNIIAPPGTSTTLTGVSVTTHRLSVSIPIR